MAINIKKRNMNINTRNSPSKTNSKLDYMYVDQYYYPLVFSEVENIIYPLFVSQSKKTRVWKTPAWAPIGNDWAYKDGLAISDNKPIGKYNLITYILMLRP